MTIDTRTISPTGAHSNSIGPAPADTASGAAAVTHVVKSWPWLFEPMRLEAKKCDIRNKRERHYKIGDFMRLQEFDPRFGKYTGRELLVKITHMIDNNTPCALSSSCLADDYVVLSVERVVMQDKESPYLFDQQMQGDSGATGPKYAPAELEKLSKIRADVEKKMPPLHTIPFGPAPRPPEGGVLFRYTGSGQITNGLGNWAVCAASFNGDPDGPWVWTRDL